MKKADYISNKEKNSYGQILLVLLVLANSKLTKTQIIRILHYLRYQLINDKHDDLLKSTKIIIQVMKGHQDVASKKIN